MTQHVSLSAIADHILEVKSLDSFSMGHLDTCSDCQSDLQWLTVLRNLGRSDPPESAVTDATQLFKPETDAA